MEWIVTGNVYDETWRRLMALSNVDLAIDEIILRHGAPESNAHAANYQKQAKQMRACILQAREYFDAATSSSLFTSPNHLYYGCIALASMSMLLLGNGEKSLDVLRRNSKNGHHGLDFTTGCSAKDASVGLNIVEKTYAKVLPNGHFSNWYSTLPKVAPKFAIQTRKQGSGSIIGFDRFGGEELLEFVKLTNSKRSVLDLLKYFPDLAKDFQRYGVSVTHSRSEIAVQLVDNHVTSVKWVLHGIQPLELRDSLLERFAIDANEHYRISTTFEDGTNSGLITLDNSGERIPFRYSWPSSRDTLDHTTISYADDVRTHEIVDCYVVAYQLSMLARYFPDLWVGCLESQCKAAKLIEQAIEILCMKVPALTLSLVSREPIIVSTHREPWRIAFR
jgi:hypothetical protein